MTAGVKDSSYQPRRGTQAHCVMTDLDAIRAAGLDSNAHSAQLLEEHRRQAAEQFQREATGG